VDRRDVDEYTVEMTFQVDEEFKGDLGDTVVIRTPGTGAQCGLGGGVGSRMALFANEEEDHLTSSLGLQVSDSIMREVTSPFPAPDGRGDARLVIGGSFGETRVLALDRAGRILGYGYGEGDVQELSICPDEKFLIDGVLLSHRLNDRGRIGGNYFVDGTGFRRWFYELYTGSLRRLDLRGEAPERSVGFVSHITFALEAIPGGAPVTAPPHS